MTLLMHIDKKKLKEFWISRLWNHYVN